MPAHYKPHNQYTAQYSHRQSASNHFEPHLSSPWSTKHQLPSSPYAPSAFANMVGSFAMPLTPRPVHSTDWNRSTALPHRFKSHNSKNSDIAQPSTHAYISPPSPPTMMAGSSYPLRSGSASDSTSSTTISSTSGGNEAVWSPLRDWTEGASTVNRNRLLDYCQANDLPEPLYKTYSDRRGGRTAWSCAISIGPTLEIPARLWFDGKYVENAGEDAAERAWAALTTGDGGQDV